MHEAHCLATSRDDLTAGQVVKPYGRRFWVEDTFRDTKDIHFGMALSATHIGNTARRDRLLRIAAFAYVLLTLLGEAGERAGLDRFLKASTAKHRTMSLYNQGCYWYMAIPQMREERLVVRMKAYADVLQEHAYIRKSRVHRMAPKKTYRRAAPRQSVADPQATTQIAPCFSADMPQEMLMGKKLTVIALLVATAGSAVAMAHGENSAPPIPTDITPYPVVSDIDFAEGPAFDKQGNLYFVNYIHNGTIGRKTPDGTVSVWVETHGQANGLKVDANGDVIAADKKGKRILRISHDGKTISVLADRYGEERFRGPNDVAIDAAGNIYFTDPAGSTREKPIGSVYRIEKDGTVKRIATGLAYPNGLAVSPDQKKLFLAESRLFRVLVFDLSKDGTLSHRRTIYEITTEPDGMAFDDYGRLWIAAFEGGTVDVIQQDGKLLARIPAGGTGVSNICFWNGDAYVTVSGQHSIHRLRVYPSKG